MVRFVLLKLPNKRLHLTRAPYGDVALDCR